MHKMIVFLLGLLVATGGATSAAEIKLLSAGGMRPVLGELAAEFERTTGHALVITYGTGGAVRDRIQNGEIVDLTILPRPLMEELLKHGKIVPGTTVNIAHTEVGIGVRTGTPKPDISSVEAFKHSLLAAKSAIIPFAKGAQDMVCIG